MLFLTDWSLSLTDSHSSPVFPDIGIASHMSGDQTYIIDLPYMDTDANGEVHVILTDHDGSSTFDITIIGFELT